MTAATDNWIQNVIRAGENRSKLEPLLEQRLKVKGKSTEVLESFKDVTRFSVVWANELVRLSNELDTSIFLYYVDTFLQQFSIQRLSAFPHILSSLLDQFSHHVIRAKRPLLGLSLLQPRLPDKNTITPMHAQLMRLSFEANKCSVGLEVLDREFLSLDKCATRNDLALFHFYGALVYIAYKEWEKADDFLAIAIEAGATQTTTRPWIVRFAYSRRILLSLIMGTPLPKIPNPNSSEVSPSDDLLARDCHPYHALALAAHSSDPKQFVQTTEAQMETFKNEGTWQLVVTARLCFLHGQLRESHKAYSRVPLKDVSAASPRILSNYGRIDESNDAFVFETVCSKDPTRETVQLLDQVVRMKNLVEEKGIATTNTSKFLKSLHDVEQKREAPTVTLNMAISDDDML
ncbi:hypothetical protein B0I72DRAFT_134161 [Yarrowia lipolytica]|uniref:YALI0E34529p n=2 Tax=Yarrowia lipolytica TaxID=4952 RepID=Q6C3I5_YARLI|nr:YALI0E34529p [Yarrowia lipolytica CLIB122]AOW06391.1 hypothetical protein YALI1_E40995g [Yarrowia lipolytica]KAB8282626.1 hypothetical protein BKA91DRAFT_138108 [Yarrowia lipolytica]KAE8171160.1 hypothetical protein BKA90DRAFT_139465 [Yarrowia lipolytica]KAJ8057759.1 hypothetical protein LXG23DRAFT_54454 [Yarrowia lipolytica]QNQ00921.1 Hypothetical protein YALI2_F00466g [Yarrowia lipolytica]|eukprot:XP_504777.1 YALI0E34529p [Yarrowia lipolytica CLIB122]